MSGNWPYPGRRFSRRTCRAPTSSFMSRVVAARYTRSQAPSTAVSEVARGAGITDNSAVDLLGADVLSELFDTLNPFAKHHQYTQLECTIVFIEIEDGVARFDPMAIRTDKVTLLGKGKIDFTTEKIRLDWKTKPRKGIGVGAGTLVNPFVELGGTLSKPHISLDPVHAATTTGMAVATVGLSILGEGMWNRFSAGKKVCAKVLADAKERLELHRSEVEGD